ncbi:MAG: dockerin type I domain-containing protein, partial [Pseudomonadota bacterium]
AAVTQADWLAGDPTRSGDPDIMIIGDLNAYAKEDPIAALETAGYANLIERFEGPEAYSFLFDGQLGYLDHALANAPMLAQVEGVTEWHINADEVPLLDYNDAVQDPSEPFFLRESGALPLFAADPFRSSDHDPVIVGGTLAVAGDLTGDRTVDRSDLRRFLRALGSKRGKRRYLEAADFNSDGRIGFADLKAFLELYYQALKRRRG